MWARLPRSLRAQTKLCGRKKLYIEVWRKGGFLRSDETMGKAKFPLVGVLGVPARHYIAASTHHMAMS